MALRRRSTRRIACDTLVRARNVARSRLCSASMMAPAKLPGPRALSAATSPATPSATSAATAARQASASTASAAHSSAEPAQPMAVTRPISAWPLATVAARRPSVTTSRVAGERDDGFMGFGKARRRLGRGIAAGKGGKFALVEPHRRRAALEQALRELRARRRTLDENRVEHPGPCPLAPAPFRAERQLDRRAPLGIEGAEIDQKRIGAGDEGGDLLARYRHRRDGAGREQHVGRIGLRHRIGDAMHPRRAAPDPRPARRR